MFKKQLLNTGIVALVVVTSLLVLRGAARPAKTSPICCKKAIMRCADGIRTVEPTTGDIENVQPGFSSLIFSFSS